MASHCSGISFCGAQALGIGALVVAALGLSSCGTQMLVAHGMWNLPIPGIEPMSPTLAAGFLTTVPPGSPILLFFILFSFNMYHIFFPCELCIFSVVRRNSCIYLEIRCQGKS